jgi:colanic acid biosynthesis protein WcaH
MFLESDIFKIIVDSMPLISIDLVVANPVGQVLLGQRLNRPAKGYWFVPGGRVQKGETLDQAFMRLTRVELGVTHQRTHAQFLGVYEHFYEDSFFGRDVGTHYIVLGYRLIIPDLTVLPKDQHAVYRWSSEQELVSAPDVHANTKAYFAHHNICA